MWLKHKHNDKGGVMLGLYDSETGNRFEYTFAFGEPVEMPKRHAEFILNGGSGSDFEECEAPKEPIKAIKRKKRDIDG